MTKETTGLRFPFPEARRAVRIALEEDRVAEDLTTLAVVPRDLRIEARLITRERGVAAGLPVLPLVFRALDRRVRVRALVPEGSRIRPGQTLARIRGPARAILAGERTALNFIARLSGVATLCRRFVDRAGRRTRIFDTRKTTPGLRALEKYAVLQGGGRNHRSHLAQAVLIKDNHIALAGDLAGAVLRARAALGGRPVEVEASTPAQVRAALDVGAEAVLLDNMTPSRAAAAVRLARGRAVTEISGGVRLSNVRAYARAGADRISVGALTHGARALDLSLELG